MSVWFWSPRRRIILGDCVQLGERCSLQWTITFGSKVLVDRQVAFIGRDDHRIDIVGCTMWDSGRGDTHETAVEDDVWIGHGAIIIAGVNIGRGAVVEPGSVVASDVPRYAIVAGSPARVLRWRFSPAQIAQHEKLLAYPDESVLTLTRPVAT